VIEGAVRSYKLLSDGRRQINAFHLVGDIFGLENDGTHRFTAEAIVETTVRLMKRVSLSLHAGNRVTRSVHASRQGRSWFSRSNPTPDRVAGPAQTLRIGSLAALALLTGDGAKPGSEIASVERRLFQIRGMTQ
jgi:hypothetical protein